MRMLKCFTYLCFLLCLAWSMPVQSQTTSRFAIHVVSEPDSSGFLFFLDPSNTIASADLVEPPIEPEWETPDLWAVYPGSEWIAYAAGSSDEDGRVPRFARVLNINTGMWNDLPAGIVLRLMWSPDGNMLLINLRQNEAFQTLVYHLDTQSLQTVSLDTTYPLSLAWSPDGAQVAALFQRCTASDTCAPQIDIIDIRTGNREVSPAFSGFEPVNGYGCSLEWSPDMSYISFMVGCPETQTALVAKEMFLWDREERRIQQITNFTTPAFEPGGSGTANADYRTLWVDNNTLLIGGDFSSFNPQDDGVYLYRPEEASLSKLFNFRITEWDYNPIADRIAARQSELVGPNPISAQDAAESTLIFSLAPNSTQNDGAQPTVNQSSLPPGCNFHWSPDGATLAYTTANCPGSTTASFIFVNAATGAYTEFTPTLPDGSMPLAVVPLGWVRR